MKLRPHDDACGFFAQCKDTNSHELHRLISGLVQICRSECMLLTKLRAFFLKKGHSPIANVAHKDGPRAVNPD